MILLFSRVQIYQCILLYYLVQGLSLTEQEFREEKKIIEIISTIRKQQMAMIKKVFLFQI